MIKLSDPVTKIKYVNDGYSGKLEILGIKNIKDLITHFPRSYNDTTEITAIEKINNFPVIGEEYTFRGFVSKFNSIVLRNRKTLQKVVFEDETGKFECTYFNQKFLNRVFKLDHEFLVTVKVTEKNGKINFYSKNYEEVLENRENIHLGRISPEYRLTSGVAKKWFRNRMKSAVDLVKEHEIEIPNELKQIGIDQDINPYIEEVHFPTSEENLNQAQKALTILELAEVHLKVKEMNKNKKIKSDFKLENITKFANEFLKELPFELTTDQENVIGNLIEKLNRGALVNDLLQGDVGSGKTIVAILLSYIFAKNNYQTVILTPTTVLAKQHFESFHKFIKDKDMRVTLEIGDTKMTEESDIIIGTTAVLARKEGLIKNLGLIIVDEQHRFGVDQRKELSKMFKMKLTPHLLDMTATPIPRTIAETFFSDLEVHRITTMPKGRKSVKTFLVNKEKRNDSFKWIKDEILSKNQQIYWICPLVDESDKIQAKSVKEIYEELVAVFGEDEVGLLHGKMKSKDKTEIMKQFSNNEFKILVSTTVIEVGVDVPNATVMVIENSERFGLAQLHQIRGRVGRSDIQSYCFLYYGDEISEQSKERLKFFEKENNGLKIAEFDLQQRGPGEVYGTMQSGIPDLKIAKLNDINLIQHSKKIADKLFAKKIKHIELFR
jgi:ATP-dependent DNA helicase RecG